MQKLIEKTFGAMRHVLDKVGLKGYLPVGFSIVFYNPNKVDSDKKWYYDTRVIIEADNPAPYEAKLRDRIKLVNDFLSEGVKRILEGEIDDMIVDEDRVDTLVFQIPGQKGRA